MTKWFDGFTAFTEDPDDCLGLVKVYSNMSDLMFYSSTSQGSYSAEITFPAANAHKLLPANPLCLTLRKNLETWKLIGQILSSSHDNVKINLTAVEYYVDGDENLKWDVFKNIHRVKGHDFMEETRKNIGMQ